MIQLILAAIVIAFLWFYMANRPAPRSEHYGTALHSDVQKAQDAADKANQKIQDDMKELNKGLSQSDDPK